MMTKKKPPSPKEISRLHQHCLGIVGLQEIHHYQKTMELLILKLLFAHLMWELSQDYHPRNVAMESHSWQGLVIRSLQGASEYILVGLLEDANLCTIHATHITMQPRDLQLAQ